MRISDWSSDVCSSDLSSVAEGATELKSVASSMSGIANRTEEKSVTVAAAAEQASANVSTVASATEEINASLAEIASQVPAPRRSEERRVGKEGVRKSRYRWAPYH